MGILSWIVFGLIAGVLAKWIMPGKSNTGFILTVLLGVGGAFLGGWVGSFFGFGTTGGFSLEGMGTAIVGALLLLFIYGLIKK